MNAGLFSRARAIPAIAAAVLLLSGCYVFYSQNVPWDSSASSGPTITETFRIGPYNLAPINTPGWEVIGNRSMPRPAGNFALKGMTFRVVDGTGAEIGMDKVHLHHIVMIDESQPDALCPEVGARFGGTGGERTPMKLLGNYAYRVDAGDVWASNFHIHTTTATASPNSYIEYTVTYQAITDPEDFRFTTPYFLDVTGCWSNSASLYDVPGGGGSGSEHVASATYTMPEDGIVVFSGGHIHAGATEVNLTREATEEEYCKASASYAPGGHPNHPNMGQLQKISWCFVHSEVNAGEQFSLAARYDNEFPVLKAMGIMLAHVWHPDE